MDELEFCYVLNQFQLHDPEAADAAMTSPQCHLWYITPELVVFGLFDPNVSVPERESMAGVDNIAQPAAFQPGKPGQPKFYPNWSTSC